MERYQRTGTMPQIGGQLYGDFSELKSYQESLNLVNEAKEMFMRLSSRVRERFGHSPEKLIDFVMDERNRDEAISLGLIVEKEKEDGGNEEAAKAAKKDDKKAAASKNAAD